MKAIKSYLCFTPFLYRVLVLVLVPVASCVLECRLMLDYMMPLYLFLMLLVIVEVFTDYWTFGGICAKGFHGSEYMKSSTNGKNVLKTALFVDCIRKFLWLALLAGVNILYYYLKTGEPVTADVMQVIIGMIVSAYCAILIGNYIGRYVQNYMILILIAYLAGIIYFTLSFGMLMIPFPVWILGIAAGIGLTYLLVWNVMKKMEGSYYDGSD